MGFYDALQLDPGVLKPKIKNAETKKEKHLLQFAMVLRSLLIVAFAIVFISPVSNFFGSENSPMAVAIFCILLGVRFVDFGYCITDSMINLAIVFLLLLFAPVLASTLNPLLAILVHAAAFFTILVMTSDQPELGNGGLYSFAYVYLSGNPVTGELLWKRCIVALIGYILCGAIFFFKHRKNNKDIRFYNILSNFSLTTEKYRWQVRLAVGTALMLGLGKMVGLERFMWAGFACASMMSSYPYIKDVKQRISHRIIGVVAGSLIYLVICKITPESLQFLFGPIGGFCLGFCTDYRFKNTMNCFGALMMATSLYGVEGSVFLRIFDNIIGVLFAFVFVFLFTQIVDRICENKTSKTPEVQI